MRTITRTIVILAAAALVLGAGAAPASAQIFSVSVTPASFSYPSADPDVSPTVVSPALTINYWLLLNGSRPWVITLRATSDLTSGSDTIPCANVTWTASPAPFVNGTLSTVARNLASGTGSVFPPKTASVTFTLKNLWTYNAGAYTHTLVFTFSTP